MPKRILKFSLFLFLIFQTFMATSQQFPLEKLYPWKNKSGLFGYSNQDGQLRIEPQFQDAGLFTNQFAIIENDGLKGVINNEGVIILDCRYDKLQLAAIENKTLAITCRKYNAWWKVNQWKLFPGFSIMGGSRDNRIFDTGVPRMKWEIVLLNDKQTVISSDHRPNEYPYDTSNIQHFANKILINDQLYQISEGKIRHIRGIFKGVLMDSTLLRNDGNSYQLVDSALKRQSNAVFKVPEKITVKVGESLKQLKTSSRVSGIKVKFDFMEDQHAHIYLYPDLKKIFPGQMNKYFDQETDAAEIISNAQMICSVPGTDYFLIYSIIHHRKEFYILHRNGTWERDRTATKDFIVRSNSGNLMYPSVNELGINHFLPKNFELKRIERTLANKYWFAVSGIIEPGYPSLSGIFDTRAKKWVLPVAYSSLEQMKGYPYVWKFQHRDDIDHKMKKYGLIDIGTGRIIAAPMYNTLNANGQAGIYTEEKWNMFYINPVTGKEYRE